MNREMILVYVAGPYNARTPLGVIYNILRARYWAKKIWRLGFSAFCPHSNSAFFNYGRRVPEKQIMAACVDMINRVDVLFVIPNSENSAGVKIEIEEAKRLGTPIVENLKELIFATIAIS